jgi:hypothetical protein
MRSGVSGAVVLSRRSANIAVLAPIDHHQQVRAAVGTGNLTALIFKMHAMHTPQAPN